MANGVATEKNRFMNFEERKTDYDSIVTNMTKEWVAQNQEVNDKQSNPYGTINQRSGSALCAGK